MIKLNHTKTNFFMLFVLPTTFSLIGSSLLYKFTNISKYFLTLAVLIIAILTILVSKSIEYIYRIKNHPLEQLLKNETHKSFDNNTQPQQLELENLTEDFKIQYANQCPYFTEFSRLSGVYEEIQASDSFRQKVKRSLGITNESEDEDLRNPLNYKIYYAKYGPPKHHTLKTFKAKITNFSQSDNDKYISNLENPQKAQNIFLLQYKDHKVINLDNLAQFKLADCFVFEKNHPQLVPFQMKNLQSILIPQKDPENIIYRVAINDDPNEYFDMKYIFSKPWSDIITTYQPGPNYTKAEIRANCIKEILPLRCSLNQLIN